MAPNIPAASRKVARTEMLKMLFLNSAGVMIGSAARISIRMKAVSSTMARTSSPMIWTEPQAYCVPAHEKPSSSATEPATRVTAPR